MALALAACLILVAAVTVAQAFDPAYEAKDFSKTQERTRIFGTPEYQAQLRQQSLENRANATLIAANDPERNFMANLCATGEDGCAGDVRLYDWGPKGYGIVNDIIEGDASSFRKAVLDYARQFCPPNKASFAVGMIKRSVQTGAEIPLEEALALERELQAQLFASKDAKEGIAAYVEKRVPNFTGR